MVGLLALVAQRLQPAFDSVAPGADPVVRPTGRADFQANGALPLATHTGQDARALAERIVAAADLGDLCARVEVAGRGFINLTISADFISAALTTASGDLRPGNARSGTTPTTSPRTVVVDYAAPNVAKEMHVGHLRSTIIGDSLCRLLGLTGDRVIRENHIGDWGTPFGMLIEHLVDLGEEAGAAELSVGDLDAFYRQARSKFDASDAFGDRSRQRVVQLQSGDPETLRLWRILVEESVRYFDEVYAKLGVLLTSSDVVGESFYNDLLPAVVSDLDALGFLVDSDGARCVFPPGYTNREGEPLPLIVQKSDGGYGYAASDLAAIRDRFGRLEADVILYVVGAPQAQHLEMCFAVARMAGWIPDSGRAVHVSFGSILGTDRKMFKSRTGERIKLVELLDEAGERAALAVADKNPELDGEERAVVARQVGIGALKYADLATDRTRDYVFDWDRMLAFEGNTAPYLQYAHARIRSIFRRGGEDPQRYRSGQIPVRVNEPAERALGLQLLSFDTAVDAALEIWGPHKLCAYLFDLAGAFTTFYETCSVLNADDEATRHSRLVLCEMTAQILAQGLDLLGIEAPDRM